MFLNIHSGDYKTLTLSAPGSENYDQHRGGGGGQMARSMFTCLFTTYMLPNVKILPKHIRQCNKDTFLKKIESVFIMSCSAWPEIASQNILINFHQIMLKKYHLKY